jgi:hypothetical protein
VIKFFSCVQLNPSTSVVSALPAISCNSDEYARFRPQFVCLLLLVVMLGPLGLIASLVYGRKRGWFSQQKYILRYGEM